MSTEENQLVEELKKAAVHWKEDPHNIPIYPPGYFNQGAVSFKGFVGTDVFGRKYIDRCPNNEHHLTKAEVPSGKERPECRFYLDDLLSHEIVGAEAEIQFEIRITPRTGAPDVRDE